MEKVIIDRTDKVFGYVEKKIEKQRDKKTKRQIKFLALELY
jgi:hypothetical protein